MRPVIEAIGLSRVYRTASTAVHAVRDVSLAVQPAEFVAIMGASGSGKSTLMNLLGCLDRPTAGSYRLNGTDISRLGSDALAAVRNRSIGFIFQGFNLLPRTSALENVELPMQYAIPSLDGRTIRQRAVAALRTVGLAERMTHVSGELSGGQQQRVAIARALVLNPVLVLADEPTGNLDSRTSIEIMGIFQKLNAAGVTIVMVTHEADIARYTRRRIVMSDGRIIVDEPIASRLAADVELARRPSGESAGVAGAPAETPETSRQLSPSR